MEATVYQSRFRHTVAKPDTRFWANAKIHDYKIRANASQFAVPWLSPSGNYLAVLSHRAECAGRLPDSPALLTCPSGITDFDLHPFKENVLVTGSLDGVVRVWTVPEHDGGLSMHSVEMVPPLDQCSTELRGHDKWTMSSLVSFHPSVCNLLCSAGGDQVIRLWDLDKGMSQTALTGHAGPILSLCWNDQGSLLATSCQDRMVRIYDPRAKQDHVQSFIGHEASKPSSVVWGRKNRLCSVGYSRGVGGSYYYGTTGIHPPAWEQCKYHPRHPERALRSMNQELICSICVKSLYGTVQGEGVKMVEMDQLEPYGYYVNADFKQGDKIMQAGVLLPKRLNDVNKCEVACFLKLSKDAVQRLSLNVPRMGRRNTNYFQEDLFPPCPNGVPGCTVTEWYAGQQAVLPLMSMQPEGTISVYDVPESEGGKRRTSSLTLKKKISLTALKTTGSLGMKGQARRSGATWGSSVVTLCKEQLEMEGELQQLTNSYLGSWTPRWVALKEGVLYVFESKSAASSQLRLSVSSTTIVTYPDTSLWLNSSLALAIKDTRQPGLDLHLKAGSAEEAQRWKGAIEKVASAIPAEETSKEAALMEGSVSVGFDDAEPQSFYGTLHAPTDNLPFRLELYPGLKMDRPASVIALTMAVMERAGTTLTITTPVESLTLYHQDDASASLDEWDEALQKALQQFSLTDSDRSYYVTSQGDVLKVRKPGTLFYTWEPMWCRVVGDVLQFAPLDAKTSVVDDIHLSRIRLVLSSSNNGSNIEETDFQLVSVSRVYFIRASSRSRKAAWIGELARLCPDLADPPYEPTPLEGEGTSFYSAHSEVMSSSSTDSLPVVPTTMKGMVGLQGGLLGRYTDYYVMFLGDELLYFTSANMDDKPQNTVSLKDIVNITTPETSPDEFVVVTDTQSFDHKCKNGMDRDQWVECLREAKANNIDWCAKWGISETDLVDDPRNLKAVKLLEPLDIRQGLHPVLIEYWGSRKIHARTVQATSESIVSGRVYLLDKGNALYLWAGTGSSRVVRAIALDAAVTINKKERGGGAYIIQLEEGGVGEHKFWKEIGAPTGRPAPADASQARPDNVSIYRVRDHVYLSKRIVRVFDGPTAHCKPRKNLLSSHSAHIVDCESSLFVWIGRHSTGSVRRLAEQAARVLKIDPQRPEWVGLFRAVQQGETVHFQTYFDGFEGTPPVNLRPVDPRGHVAMTRQEQQIDVMSLHGAEPSDDHATQQLLERDPDPHGTTKVWRVDGLQIVEQEAGPEGQFFSACSYVVHYRYTYGDRVCHVIYYWQGRDSSINEKGAAALWTVEKSKRREAVQMLVHQGKESRHFVHIWPQYVVWRGRFRPLSINAPTMLDVRDTPGCEGAATAVEVSCTVRHLHPWHCSVVLTPTTAYVWCGPYCTQSERDFAMRLAEKHKGQGDLGICENGTATDASFWEALGQYVTPGTLPLNHIGARHPVRMFRFTSSSGSTHAELLPRFCLGHMDPGVVLLVDVFYTVYTWFGSQSKVSDRTAALQVAFEFIKTSPVGHLPDTPIRVVYEGTEPLDYLACFHGWAAPHLDHNGTGGSSEDGRTVLGAYTRQTYTCSELCADTLPPGVDPSNKERYLSPEDFEDLFEMKAEEYDKLPRWQQLKLKKQHGMY